MNRIKWLKLAEVLGVGALAKMVDKILDSRLAGVVVGAFFLVSVAYLGFARLLSIRVPEIWLSWTLAVLFLSGGLLLAYAMLAASHWWWRKHEQYKATERK